MTLIIKIARHLRLGLSSIWSHRLRSSLTGLGIVFGVASVICMLAIGEGLSYEAREQIRRLGSNNIIVRSVKPPQTSQDDDQGRQIMQYGLTYDDIERIAATVPKADVIVPERKVKQEVVFQGRRTDADLVGTVPWYPSVTGARMLRGRFLTSVDVHERATVGILSSVLAEQLGRMTDPLNKYIRVGSDYYRVIGIMQSDFSGAATPPRAGGQASRGQLLVPLTTARGRLGELISDTSSGGLSVERVELHGAIIRVPDSDDVLPTARLIESLLKRFHEKQDFEMIVPLQLLAEKERVKRLYNIVLGLMAAISLLVGGIGIMNIMLATVSERTPEIGIRRAVGAKRQDIMLQFLTETVMLSGLGGLLGVSLGLTLPKLIQTITEVTTIVTPWAVITAFGISAVIGIVFGFYPAVRAAAMDPIHALRHE
ncbi:MAG: ABC transporter permease [Candidatus Pacebacteria bacterium]|nr:ABC transporter permease [Candidatus Paceibacterota bacterium]